LMYNSLVCDNKENPIGMAARLRDITELKKYERALRRSKQEKETVLNSGRFCYEIWSQRSQPCSDCPVLKAMKIGNISVLLCVDFLEVLDKN